ncbi:MAG: ABC-F family ATPase [Deltaproteobacteria bacterium CG11_big_fil_rev_8_21_14_0_20_47_16]|nr:MAG: ABC-F family ATPase [Deltaproteobacteria bacterium CG11_big_fil_rev_8_21_14_0_20_47_16]
MLTLQKVSRVFPNQVVLDKVTLHIKKGVHYGIVGMNGTGKSTLLKLLAGVESPDEGSVDRRAGSTVGVLEQDQFQYDHIPIVEVAEMGNAVLHDLKVKMDALAVKMQSPDADIEKLGMEFAHLQADFDHQEGYTLRARAEQMLMGLGFAVNDMERKLSEFSGGYKARILLAKLLMGEPDLLLLDEPTNHLDLTTIHWLGDYIKGMKQTVVVVSHDREFLNLTSDHILHIAASRITDYTGNYDEYRRMYAIRADIESKVTAKAEDRINQLQRFVDQFGAKASKARQAQSKAKMIQKMEDELEGLERVAVVEKAPTFDFGQRIQSTEHILQVKGLAKSYDDEMIFENVKFALRRGDRAAIVAPNGVGKTTLLKILAGVQPETEGSYHWGHAVEIGYFAQQQKEILPEAMNIFDYMCSLSNGQLMPRIRTILGRLMFSGDTVKKPMGVLSGGELSRVVFGQIMLQQPNTLILDEPTNHLDMESRENLLAALKEYPGTILFVSHDQYFLDQLATRIIRLDRHQTDDYLGGYQDYLRKNGMDYLGHVVAESKPTKHRETTQVESKEGSVSKEGQRKERAAERAKVNERLKPLQKELAACEEKVATLEARLKEITHTMAHPKRVDGKTDWDSVAGLGKEKKQIETDLAHLEAEWEQLQKEIEAIQAAV